MVVSTSTCLALGWAVCSATSGVILSCLTSRTGPSLSGVSTTRCVSALSPFALPLLIRKQAVRALTPWIFSGQVENPPPNVTWNAVSAYYEVDDVSWHDVRKLETADLIRQIGEDSAVLLKNTNKTLPLRNPKVIAIIGSDAGPNDLSPLDGAGFGSFPVWNNNGTLSLGGGSGWQIPPYVVTPYEAINWRGRKSGAQVYSVFNDTAYDAIGTTVQSADVALVFVSAYAMEGEDRASLYL